MKNRELSTKIPVITSYKKGQRTRNHFNGSVMLNGEKRQAKLDQPWIGNQKERDKGKAKKTLDRWQKTKTRETRYCELGRVD
jgi:hypothetical protein